MRPLSIADYLDRLGSSAEEKAPPRPEGSPFRPRSLPSPQTAASGAKPVFDRLTNKGGETQGEEAPRRSPWAPRPASLESGARESPSAGEPVKPLLRIGEERKRSFPWADQHIVTSSSIFHAWKYPRACVQFGWQETSPVRGDALLPTIAHRSGKLVGSGRHVWAL